MPLILSLSKDGGLGAPQRFYWAGGWEPTLIIFCRLRAVRLDPKGQSQPGVPRWPRNRGETLRKLRDVEGIACRLH